MNHRRRRSNKALHSDAPRPAGSGFPRSLRSLGAGERRRYMRQEFIRAGLANVADNSLPIFLAAAASGDEQIDLSAGAYNKALHATPVALRAPGSLAALGARERRRYMREESMRAGSVKDRATASSLFSTTAASGNEHRDLEARAYNKALQRTPAALRAAGSLAALGAAERRR